jgi:hypothetical protein
MNHDFGRDLGSKPLLLPSGRGLQEQRLFEEVAMPIRRWRTDVVSWVEPVRSAQKAAKSGSDSSSDSSDSDSSSAEMEAVGSAHSEPCENCDWAKGWQAELQATLGGLQDMNDIFLVEDKKIQRLLTKAEKLAKQKADQAAEKLADDAEDAAANETSEDWTGMIETDEWFRGEVVALYDDWWYH